MRRIYLDNAATSFPKPDAVYDAIDRYNRQVGASERGNYASGTQATAAVRGCRSRLARLFGIESQADRLIFTHNGTDSLNIALHGLLAAGDHVVTSALEHNSVVRPLHELKLRHGVETTVVDADATGRVDPAVFARALRPSTKLVVLVHASNVTGAVLPIAEVGEIARRAGVLFLVDAAQTAGQLPINLGDLPVDVLACPGHKGLLGPLGTGVLYVGPDASERMASFRQGGTGTESEDEMQPAALPYKYESGNNNVPGIAGLEAGAAWLLERDIASVHQHEKQLVERLLSGLAGLAGVRLYGPAAGADRVGVVSLTIDGFDPHELAGILNQSFGIEVRAGLHCAPGAHRSIGTFESGGTLRISTGPFTTADEIDATLDALRQIAGST
ncbi:MAG: aminotransferase class V-fold PLP-dependent enzyme [Planctomycetia bacterium]|nr:aminotransferase class V-fold PLP-dependent enzyme [Planctomycetia bacterium]